MRGEKPPLRTVIVLRNSDGLTNLLDPEPLDTSTEQIEHSDASEGSPAVMPPIFSVTKPPTTTTTNPYQGISKNDFYQRIQSQAGEWRVRSQLWKIVNAVHKIVKSCERRSQYCEKLWTPFTIAFRKFLKMYPLRGKHGRRLRGWLGPFWSKKEIVKIRNEA